jgi:hypothetical protein
MIKQLIFIMPIVTATLFLSGCASSPIEKRLENNFVYQCSLQLFDKLDRKITGEGAEKICSAAERSDLAGKGAAPKAEAEVAPAPAAASPAPASTAKATDTDEVKAEPVTPVKKTEKE